jgi:hypothetical protein
VSIYPRYGDILSLFLFILLWWVLLQKEHIDEFGLIRIRDFMNLRRPLSGGMHYRIAGCRSRVLVRLMLGKRNSKRFLSTWLWALYVSILLFHIIAVCGSIAGCSFKEHLTQNVRNLSANEALHKRKESV